MTASLKCDSFQRTDTDNWLLVDLRPAFRRCQTDAQSRERSRPGRHGEQVKFLEFQRQIPKQKLQMAENTRRIVLFGARGNDAEGDFVTQDCDASGGRRGVQGEDEHVHQYRAIWGPILLKTFGFSDLRRRAKPPIYLDVYDPCA